MIADSSRSGRTDRRAHSLQVLTLKLSTQPVHTEHTHTNSQGNQAAMLSMLPIFNAELESMFKMPLIDDKAISLQSDDSGYHINC
eukprot:6200722-Pleurochrysis_carterae.AAC.1